MVILLKDQWLLSDCSASPCSFKSFDGILYHQKKYDREKNYLKKRVSGFYYKRFVIQEHVTRPLAKTRDKTSYQSIRRLPDVNGFCAFFTALLAG